MKFNPCEKNLTTIIVHQQLTAIINTSYIFSSIALLSGELSLLGILEASVFDYSDKHEEIDIWQVMYNCVASSDNK